MGNLFFDEGPRVTLDVRPGDVIRITDDTYSSLGAYLLVEKVFGLTSDVDIWCRSMQLHRICQGGLGVHEAGTCGTTRFYNDAGQPRVEVIMRGDERV